MTNHDEDFIAKRDRAGAEAKPPIEGLHTEREDRELAEFWISRYLRETEREAAPPDQEQMAKDGVPYAERQARISAYERNLPMIEKRLRGLRYALAKVRG